MPTLRTYQTRSGPMMALETDAYVARSLEVYGEYCPDEWNLLRQLILPGMTVVELGANFGTHSVNMARACAPGRFHAFEPQTRIFQILCANLAINNIENAITYQEACGAGEGWAVMPDIAYDQPGNFGGAALQPQGSAGQPVRVRALDSLELPSLGLLKIDVEGFEPQVLEGARATITRFRPVIYIENDRPENQQALISTLTQMGYRLYWHVPALFPPDNFNGAREDIFGRVHSLNMLCIPDESQVTLQGFEQIDPADWRSPIG